MQKAGFLMTRLISRFYCAKAQTLSSSIKLRYVTQFSNRLPHNKMCLNVSCKDYDQHVGITVCIKSKNSKRKNMKFIIKV